MTVGTGIEEVGGREPAAALTPDRDLAARILAGDQAAFEELVRSTHPRLARIVGRFFRRREIVEEVLQEVFLKAFQGLARFRGDVPIEHWLSRIAVNACYDELRRKKRQPETLISEIAGETEDFFERLRMPDDSAQETYWEREDARLMAEQILARLAPAERLVLTLMVLEERTVAQVAAVTGWSRANVKIRAFRARNKLRRLLDKGELKDREGG